MSWARDDSKLERVRALLAEEELDALVVRAPDNVLYLTNFLRMKGYKASVFPRFTQKTFGSSGSRSRIIAAASLGVAGGFAGGSIV